MFVRLATSTCSASVSGISMETIWSDTSLDDRPGVSGEDVELAARTDSG